MGNGKQEGGTVPAGIDTCEARQLHDLADRLPWGSILGQLIGLQRLQVNAGCYSGLRRACESGAWPRSLRRAPLRSLAGGTFILALTSNTYARNRVPSRS